MDKPRWEPYRRGLLPLDHTREIFRNLRQIHDAGYYLLDFLPWNVIVDRAEGVKFVDLEFLYPYERSPESFETSFSLRGVPRGFPQDIPFGPRDVYAEVWQPSIGLTLQSLLEDPTTVQRLKRILHRTRGALRSLSGKAGTRPESADG